MNLFTKGANKKLGQNVFAFNLPVFKTCPGRTPTCCAVCYSGQGYAGYHRKRYAANLAISRTSDFAPRAIDELVSRHALFCRPHVAGDYYSAEYVRKWIEIASTLPHVRFWAYTRSWRSPRILPELERLAALPNFRLWFSADRDSPAPPKVDRVKVCWLLAGNELPPRGVDLVFTTRYPIAPSLVKSKAPRIPQPEIGGVAVCPHYGGADATKLPCETCQLCIN